MNFREELVSLNACADAIKWVGDRTREQAWAECPWADWLLWYAAKSGVPIARVIEAACAVVRTVVHHCADDRARAALDLAERWARGEAVTEAELTASFRSATAYAAAASYAAAHAAAAAAYAAADAADYSADALVAVMDAIDYAQEAAARTGFAREVATAHANVVRSMISLPEGQKNDLV